MIPGETFIVLALVFTMTITFARSVPFLRRIFSALAVSLIEA